jgi:hypothetical protein
VEELARMDYNRLSPIQALQKLAEYAEKARKRNR